MGRAQQGQVNSEATGLLNTETGDASKAQSLLMPSYSAELANPGYTQAQKDSITSATTGGVGAAFGSASEGAANRAARTNNAAGLTSNQDALSRQKMITSGNLAAQNQETFANDAQKQQAQAQGGLAGLFGQNLQGANATLGHQAQNAQTPGFWDTFGNSLATTLGKDMVPGGSVGGFNFG